MNRLASKPVPIQALGYEYDGELSVDGIRRAEPSEIIQQLFQPEESSHSESGQWCFDRAAPTVTAAWLRVQLDLYGIRYPGSSSREDRLELLRQEALKPDFGTLHTSVFRLSKFKGVRAEWEYQCRLYEESLQTGRHQEEFHALATFEEKVNYDADMFMQAYFGNRNTMRRPIALKGVRFGVVMDAAGRVPGLVTRMIGDGIQRILWLGWDERLLEAACDDYRGITRQNTAEKRRLKRKYDDDTRTCYVEREKAQEEWYSHLELSRLVGDLNKHHGYMRKRQERNDIEGSYIVEITDPDIQHRYHGMAPQWIDIRATSSPGVFEGTFDVLPIRKGVMLFSESEESLLAHADVCDAFHISGGKDNPAAFRMFQAGFMLGWQRKSQYMEDNSIDCDTTTAPRVREYMKQPTPEGTTRYYMRWRGDGNRLKDYWKPQGRRGRADERDDGWLEFRKNNGGQLIVDFGVGTVDGGVHGYKAQDEPFFTGDWATANKSGPWPVPLSAAWAH